MANSKQKGKKGEQMEVKQGLLRVRNLKDFLEKYGEMVAFVNADYVVDEHHVYFAARKAIKAWEEGRRVARTLPLEILLYSAATRQIKDALAMGVEEGENRVVAVFLDPEMSVEGFEERKVLEMNEEKFRRIAEFFDVSDIELEIAGERLGLLVRERIILFDINK